MNWSLSKYGTFTKCPASFKYAYIDRLPKPPSDSAARGIAIHQDLELFIKEGKSLPSSLSQYEGWLKALMGQDHHAEWQVALAEGWGAAKWEENPWFKGVLDLKVIAGPQGWVFDWKTGKIYPDHDDQKELYTIATFAHHPELRQVKAIHVYVDLGKNTEKTYSRDEMDFLIRKWDVKISPMMQAMKRYDADPNDTTNFSPQPNYGCRLCAFSKAANGPCRF